MRHNGHTSMDDGDLNFGPQACIGRTIYPLKQAPRLNTAYENEDPGRGEGPVIKSTCCPSKDLVLSPVLTPLPVGHVLFHSSQRI